MYHKMHGEVPQKDDIFMGDTGGTSRLDLFPENLIVNLR